MPFRIYASHHILIFIRAATLKRHKVTEEVDVCGCRPTPRNPSRTNDLPTSDNICYVNLTVRSKVIPNTSQTGHTGLKPVPLLYNYNQLPPAMRQEGLRVSGRGSLTINPNRLSYLSLYPPTIPPHIYIALYAKKYQVHVSSPSQNLPPL